MEHRWVMECHLGRRLRRDEIVHHIDGDKLNNALANLELTDAKAHSSHHNNKHPRTKRCAVCGATFTPHPTKRKRAKSCSPRCKAELLRMAAHRRWGTLPE